MSEALAAEWEAAMRSGDFAQAWKASDAIRRGGSPDPHRFWEGESIADRRVMLRCLHGLGDAVMFLRYVPMLKAVAASVCIEVPPHFVELARCFEGVDGASVITWGEGAPAQPPEWDVQIEVTELPYVFRTLQRDLPLATNYLHVDSDASPDASRRLRPGLAWEAGDWDPMRSVPFDSLHPLLQTAGCEFWTLQTHTPPSGTDITLRQDPAACKSLLALVKRMTQLDLVITVDTLAAHLAGAMGISTFLMLRKKADWRWMEQSSDTPWYPSLRLFRQQVEGDWSDVVQAVARELQERVRGSEAPNP